MRCNLNKMVAGLFVVALFGLTGCGDSSSTSVIPASVDSTGTWKGVYTSSIDGENTMTLSLLQSSSNLTGNYASTGGGLGTVSGTVSDKTASVVITVTTPGCSGSLNGTGVINTSVNPQTMAFKYSGSTNAACGGAESGTGTLTKQ